MKSTRLAAIGIAAVAVTSFGVLGAGCGSSSSSSDTTPATTASTPTSTTSATPSTATTVTVDLGKGSEFNMTSSVASAPAGKITFDVKNDGTMLHEMVVVPEPAGGVDALKQADGTADEANAVGEAPDIEAGATKSVTLDLKAGKYVLLCNLPGHFAGGMWTTFTVS